MPQEVWVAYSCVFLGLVMAWSWGLEDPRTDWLDRWNDWRFGRPGARTGPRTHIESCWNRAKAKAMRHVG